jgi:hypothetical protein
MAAMICVAENSSRLLVRCFRPANLGKLVLIIWIGLSRGSMRGDKGRNSSQNFFRVSETESSLSGGHFEPYASNSAIWSTEAAITSGGVMLMSEGPLPSRPEPICRSNSPPETSVWSGFRPEKLDGF